MRRFNTAMQTVFGAIGVIGFMGMCSVDDMAPTWFSALLISFLIFLVGFIGCVFFDNPARFIKYAAGALIVVLAAVYEFCHELKSCMKYANKYKKRCGTYKKTYRKASTQYYINNSSYRDEEENYIFGDYTKRGR